MTITVKTLLLWTAGMVAATALGLFAWQTFGQQSFHEEASAISGEVLPLIKNAPDFQTARSASQDMRSRLSVLTPPEPQRENFGAWLAGLKAVEDAMLRGDLATAQAKDAEVWRYVAALDLSDSCAPRLA